jgi:quercetin dioxygenase-like cupin family protein
MSFITLSDIPAKEIVKGFRGRFVHSKNITIAHWEVKQGTSIPVHQHVNEMIVNVIEGKLELTIDKETRLLTAGMAAVIDANVPHTAKGITDCKLIDVFYPLRPEYNND